MAEYVCRISRLVGVAQGCGQGRGAKEEFHRTSQVRLALRHNDPACISCSAFCATKRIALPLGTHRAKRRQIRWCHTAGRGARAWWGRDASGCCSPTFRQRKGRQPCGTGRPEGLRRAFQAMAENQFYAFFHRKRVENRLTAGLICRQTRAWQLFDLSIIRRWHRRRGGLHHSEGSIRI